MFGKIWMVYARIVTSIIRLYTKIPLGKKLILWSIFIDSESQWKKSGKIKFENVKVIVNKKYVNKITSVMHNTWIDMEHNAVIFFSEYNKEFYIITSFVPDENDLLHKAILNHEHGHIDALNAWNRNNRAFGWNKDLSMEDWEIAADCHACAIMGDEYARQMISVLTSKKEVEITPLNQKRLEIFRCRLERNGY